MLTYAAGFRTRDALAPATATASATATATPLSHPPPLAGGEGHAPGGGGATETETESERGAERVETGAVRVVSAPFEGGSVSQRSVSELKRLVSLIQTRAQTKRRFSLGCSPLSLLSLSLLRCVSLFPTFSLFFSRFLSLSLVKCVKQKSLMLTLSTFLKPAFIPHF